MNRREFLRRAAAVVPIAWSAPGAVAGLGSMKVRRVVLSIVTVPETRWWWSDDVYGQPAHQREEHYFFEVETDQGLTGLSEVIRVPMETIRSAARQWVGMDVLKVNLARPETPLAGAFEQAVLDLRGQALGVPIWQLLGGRLRDRIFVTQCTGYKTPQNTVEQAQWGWERGFRAYKMKCITTEDSPEKRIRYVVDRVEAIHKALPEMIVRPDIRWRLEEVWVAQELARRLEGHRMDCLESPIARVRGALDEWRRLRYSIRLPVGDHIAGTDLVAASRAEALDYAIVGSDSHLATLRDSHLARSLGMGGWSQAVAYGPGSAMGLHVAACMPNLSQAYDMVGPMAWQHLLVNEPFPFENGSFLVPDRPGLGYTLDRAAVKKHLIRQEVFG